MAELPDGRHCSPSSPNTISQHKPPSVNQTHSLAPHFKPSISAKMNASDAIFVPANMYEDQEEVRENIVDKVIANAPAGAVNAEVA